MKAYKVYPKIIQPNKEMIPNQKKNINLKKVKKTNKIPDVQIKRGIFQGDSLSSLLFIMTIDPLGRILTRMNAGYNLKTTKPSHYKPSFIYGCL